MPEPSALAKSWNSRTTVTLNSQKKIGTPSGLRYDVPRTLANSEASASMRASPSTRTTALAGNAYFDTAPDPL